jgi:glutathione S-transferase
VTCQVHDEEQLNEPTEPTQLQLDARRIAELTAALHEAATRLRAAAIAGGSDPQYADLAVAKYFQLCTDPYKGLPKGFNSAELARLWRQWMSNPRGER